MNAITPAEAAATFDHAGYHELSPDVPDAERYNGWTAEKQKRFLTALARGHNITQACAIVGLSRQSAYALRDSARGAAFALGWQAATLRARDALADELMDRAFNGVKESIIYDDGRITTRRRHDNNLAFRMLTRLDRRADAACTDTGAAAVRLAAADFEQLLDLIGREAAPARAGLFIAARMGAVAAEASEDDLAPIRALARADKWLRTHVDVSESVDTADLDPAERARWTAEQWARAEDAGLVQLAAADPDPQEDDADDAADTPLSCQPCQPDGDAATPNDDPVWWCNDADTWRTSFPPPAKFYGYQEGEVGDPFYERELTEEEEDALDARHEREMAPRIATGIVRREAYFGLPARGLADAEEEDDADEDTLDRDALDDAAFGGGNDAAFGAAYGDGNGDADAAGGHDAPPPPPSSTGPDMR